MAVEIERKFLVSDPGILENLKGIFYRQGYIEAQGAAIRVRIAGATGYLTIKGASQGISRDEYEYEIPLADAEQMLNSLCLPSQIEKTRYLINTLGNVWEVDVFAGENQGLILAEVELTSEDQIVALPDWIGKEVSSDPRYYNLNLISNPFNSW